MKIFLMVIFFPFAANAAVDLVLVDKSDRKMYIMDGDTIIKEYRIALGGSPDGHKTTEGDEKTPEGLYKLDYVNEQSSYYRSMHISYPNNEDKKQAEERGVSPGADIMVHGQKNGFGWVSSITQSFNWTKGCIAIKNSEMDEFIELVPVGTMIQINQ